jgi:SNF2 family DNA or RNA helicase
MKRCILGDPQGNGKTPQLIRAIRRARLTAEGAGPWLVVARNAVLYNWQREFGVWAPELSVRVVDGTAMKRRKAIMDEGEADVYVIGWPTVRYHTRLAAYPGQAFARCDEHGGSAGKTAAQCEVHPKELNEIRWAGVIADEAHAMKDAKSKQTRALWQLAGDAEFFWPATGTPIADNVGDLWPVLHAIDPQGFPSKSRYLDLFAVKRLNWHGGSEFLGIRPETEAAFHAIVQPLIRRVPKEIARPQMPPRLPVSYRYPEMPPAQARAYRQMQKEALADLGSATVVTDNDLARFARLCQLASAGIETYDGEDKDGFTRQRVRMTGPSVKADDLMDFLEDNPGPLVACMNSPQLLALCEAKLKDAKIAHCAILGGQSPMERDQAARWFQEGECRVILITAGAGGESITLTASDTVLFLQPNPSSTVTEQVIGRVDRIGQPNPVRVVYSLSRGTVDERLLQLSQDKHDRAAQVTRDPDLLRWLVAGGDAPAQLTTPPG